MRSVQFRPGIPNPLEAIRERNLRALWKYRSLRRDQASIRHQFRADLVIAVTKRMGDELATLPRAENARIRVVYNAIGRHIGRFPDAEAWLSARGVALPPRPRVLMVGHAGPYKNPFATVAALALPRLRGATLVRAGREMTAAERARVATQGVPMVELGTIDDATLARVYNACDVLVQPSLWEGFGIPVVEAFASGLPVVTSDGGALPEVVDGAGVVVPGIATAQPAPSAVAAFAEAIARTIEDPAHAQELRERGLERAKRFSAARIGAELADAYEEARANHRARRTGR
jgi:glycosyltransferase involved in cell wall biosynthesis